MSIGLWAYIFMEKSKSRGWKATNFIIVGTFHQRKDHLCDNTHYSIINTITISSASKLLRKVG